MTQALIQMNLPMIHFMGGTVLLIVGLASFEWMIHDMAEAVRGLKK